MESSYCGNKKLEIAQKNILLKEKHLSKYACKSEDGAWLKQDIEDIRPIFFRDTDRIIHSSGYARYIDKTQVYSFVQNDHVTRRVLHVQLVSKIARTIGRSLALNEDLIEAISLGHDIGHTPFGHKGESLLNNICKNEKIGCFYHNAESVRMLQTVEDLNISLQTLDGILAHNGEILINKYEYNPNKKAIEFLNELHNTLYVEDYSKQIIPMTLEGGVVRLADIIAYIGRDIEDAIEINDVKREEIPEKISSVLGNTNSKIVNNLILDVIENSLNKPYLHFSNNVFQAFMRLKDWNYERIYDSKLANKNYEILEKLFNNLFKYYVNKIEEKVDLNDCTNSDKILFSFLDKMILQGETDKKRIIIDYIAGQTDKFFLNECNEHVANIDVSKLYK